MAENQDVSRRQFVAAAGAVTAVAASMPRKTQGAPFIQKVKAANNQVQYAVIGTGGRGQYLLRHFKQTNDKGRCVAVCDILDENLKKGADTAGTSPRTYKDYREVLASKDVEAVVVTTPLYMHFPVTRDALMAGKHVFCEKSLVFRPEEIHGLRALANERGKQILQTGLQRRYSAFYTAAKQMVDKGMIGKVTHVQGQWHRNPGWTMKPNGKANPLNWRLFREYSGGLTAELASHQIDVADWMFGAHPEFVVGVGGLDYMKDGRDVYDHIQLIFSYPQGRRLTYTSISTNKHLPYFADQRTEFGEQIMGTEGTIQITVGTDDEPAIGLWFYEPGPKPEKTDEKKKEEAKIAGATLASTGKGARALPILLPNDQITNNDSFLARELKFARRWLYAKGVMLPEEDRNPVDVELESFLDACRTGQRPKADLEVGLEDSTAVILANRAMDEGRRVYFSEINEMGREGVESKAAAKVGAKAS
jgi:predicted dehydrogenase